MTASLPTKKRGRKRLLGEDLDSKVQLYLKKIRESEAPFQQGLSWLLPEVLF